MLDKINEFVDVINKNAPLGDGYFYPYKPALIIAIFSNHNFSVEQIFNQPIELDNDYVLKTYYNLITSDVILYDKLIKQKTNQDLSINIGFNEKLKKKLLKNIFEMPAKKMVRENGIWTINKNDCSVTINLGCECSQVELNEYRQIILNSAYKSFKKCVPSYVNFSNIEVDNYDEIVESKIFEESDKKTTEIAVRQYQHTFAKKVKDRDKKCLICCEEEPELLQAAHIKPYTDCRNTIEKYDENNGITLCANHHILFDKNKFTFNNDWTIKISNSYKNSDYYMKLKEFEACYETLQYSKSSNINIFLEYRNKKYPIM